MIRHVAAIAVAVLLSPALLHAQDAVFTVRTASADVHRSPSTGSPIVGHARQGTTLKVTRELGSWVRVEWPDAQDGAGYVHVTWGTLARGVAPQAATPAESALTRAAEQSTAAADVLLVEQRALGLSAAPVRSVSVTPATHGIGLGARMGGPTPGAFGASARAWRRNRLGLQLDVTRYALTSGLSAEHLTSIQFEPSVLYSLRDHVSDYLWVRPYVGSGLSFHRQTLRAAAAGAADSLSQRGYGIQAFGGGEMTFAGLPQFAVSADAGYLWARKPVPGFELGGLTLSVSGHWYVK
jgi:hypothetical protein